jgi:hypothetical protein
MNHLPSKGRYRYGTHSDETAMVRGDLAMSVLMVRSKVKADVVTEAESVAVLQLDDGVHNHSPRHDSPAAIGFGASGGPSSPTAH